MKKKWLMFLLILFGLYISQTLKSQTNEQLNQFEQARQAVVARDYERALKIYLQLEQAGLQSSELFSQLSQVYQNQGGRGRAVYYVLKALQLNPRNSELQERFKQLQRDSQVSQELSWFEKLKQRIFILHQFLSLKELLLVSVVVNAFFFVFWWVRYRRKEMGWRWGGRFLLLVNFWGISNGFFAYYQMYFTPYAVVVSNKISVYSEPSLQSVQLFEVVEGAYGYASPIQSDFTRLKFKEGRMGWVKNEDILILSQRLKRLQDY